jgi:hypothetical protein
LELLLNSFHIWDIHISQRGYPFVLTTPIVGIKNTVDETSVISVQPNITFEAANFITQILFTPHDGDSFVRTLNWTSHVQRLDRIEGEIWASVDGFAADFGALF